MTALGPLPFLLMLTRGEELGRQAGVANTVQGCIAKGWRVLQLHPTTGLGAEEVFKALAQYLVVG
jgi:hypothetical protein